MAAPGIRGAARQLWTVPTMMTLLLLVGLGSCTAASLSAASRQSVSVYEEPVPVVKHYKKPGSGYIPGSPLYEKQRAIARSGTHESSATSRAVAQTALVEPVSTSMRCIIKLVTQFFVVSFLLFAGHLANKYGCFEGKQEWTGLSDVARTVAFVPMLCVLFLAARMHAVHLCKGYAEKYDLPQWWVKDSMNVCSGAVLLLSVCSLLGTCVWGDYWEAQAGARTLGKEAQVWAACCKAITITVYCCFTVICIGIATMQPPPELWGDHDRNLLVSTESICTVVLSVVYFLVHLVHFASKALNNSGLLGPPHRFAKQQEMWRAATMPVAFAPMLCVLFISTRLRALQINAHGEELQPWLRVFLYVCTFSVPVLTVLGVVAAHLGLEVASLPVKDDTSVPEFKISAEDEMYWEKESQRAPLSPLGKAVEGVRFAAMVCLYIGAVFVVIGLLSMGHRGPASSPPGIPTSLQCVILLSFLYFAVYLALWFVITLQRHHTRAPPPPEMVQQAPDFLLLWRIFLERHAKEAVAFCPMLCILFMATLMRALQITDGVGAPQQWCQALQHVASWCVVILTCSRIDVLLPHAPKVEQKCAALNYVCQFAVYVFAVAVVYALLTMTPGETRGAESSVFTAQSSSAGATSKTDVWWMGSLR